MSHYFISYSRIDGQPDANRLYRALRDSDPPLKPWLDEVNVQVGSWVESIDLAIAECAAVLLVVTPDAVDSPDVSNECSRALRYKKPVLPLRFSDAIVPLRLQDFVEVDFRGDFADAVDVLRRKLEWLRSDEGVQAFLKRRLRDLERELRRATTETEWSRAEQERRDVEEELQPRRGESLRIEDANGVFDAVIRTVNRAPSPPLRSFHDRIRETQQLLDFVDDAGQRMLTVVGRAGVGKTTMVCQALHELARGRSRHDEWTTAGFDGIVYMGAGPARDISLASFYEDVCKLLPDAGRQVAENTWRDSPLTDVRVNVLTTLFETRQVIVLLDNLESLLDSTSGTIVDRELAELLRLLLVGPHHGIKTIVTTQERPRDLVGLMEQRQMLIELESGLPSPHAENLLRSMDRDGRVGLRDAPDEMLDAIRRRTLGHPKALEAFFGVLRADRLTSVDELLRAEHPPEKVVEALVAEQFNRLDTRAQAVVQALAVFNRPVPADAVKFLLPLETDSASTDAVLRRLEAMYLVRYDHGKYFLHPLDRAYALSRLETGWPGDWIDRREDEPPTLSSLRFLGAEYFRAQRPDEITGTADIEPAMIEFELRSESGDVGGAIEILNQYAGVMIELGHRRPLIELAESVYDLASEAERTSLLALTGYALAALGEEREAARRLQLAIGRSPGDADPQEIARWRLELAFCFHALRELDAAVDELDRVLATDNVATSTEASALLALARIALTRGRYDEADHLQCRALRRALLAAPRVVVGDEESSGDASWETRISALEIFNADAWEPVEAARFVEVGDESDREREEAEPFLGLVVSIRAARHDDPDEHVLVSDTLLGAIWLERASLAFARDDLVAAEVACQLAGVMYESLDAFERLQAINLLNDIRAESEPDDDLIEEQERALDDARERRILPVEADLLGRLGQAYLERHRLEDAEEAFRELQQLGRQENDLEQLVVATEGLARVDWIRDDLDSAVAALEDLLAELPDDDIQSRARIHVLLGDIAGSRFRNDLVTKHLNRARALYAELGDWQPMITTEQRLASTEIDTRDYESAVHRLEGVASLTRSIGVPSLTVSILGSLANARLSAGDREGAVAAAEEARQVVEGARIPASVAELSGAAGDMWTELENYDAAIEAYQQARTIYQQLGRRAQAVHVLRMLAYVYGEAESYEEELSVASEAAELAPLLGDPAEVRSTRVALALALADLTRYEEAVALIESVLEAHPKDPYALGNAAWVYFLAGRHEDSLCLSKQALEIDPHQVWVVRNMAHAALAMGRPDEAEAHYRAAIEHRKGGESFTRTIREVRRLLDRVPDLPRGQEMLALLEDAQAALT